MHLTTDHDETILRRTEHSVGGGRRTVPREEYPRPQFVRADWLNLNGQWEFERDPGDSGLARGLLDRPLRERIAVPFCLESTLSGIGDTDFCPAVWYRREVEIPREWHGRRVLLHLQAVDYDATVWADGEQVGRHRGGSTPVSIDLGPRTGTITVVVRARDPATTPQARGKQSVRYENYACSYTRTTGIWQTVWLEPVADLHLRRPRITPDLAGSSFHLELPLSANRPGSSVEVTLLDAEGGELSTTSVRGDLNRTVRAVVPVESPQAWSPGQPYLYGLRFRVHDGAGALVDEVRSYAGLRSIGLDGRAVLLNGERLFQRLVLDQGYYPDGIMTAPDDAALVRDIELSMAAGFNGARCHQKVFEERFLYHADRLGYLVWGEFGDWGCNTAELTGGWDAVGVQQPGPSYITQWLEALERDYSHPSIIGWCPLNETRENIGDTITPLDDVMRGMFLATRAADSTRPVLDSSGYSHRVSETDIYDSHNYEQDPATFRTEMAGLADGAPYVNRGRGDGAWSMPYAGQPYFCSEFGGIWWNPGAGEDEDSWGYGARPADLAAFYERFAGLVDALLDDPLMFGYCYTQLTDVFQEQNGIYRFDRTTKFDVDRLRAIQRRTAAFEMKR